MKFSRHVILGKYTGEWTNLARNDPNYLSNSIKMDVPLTEYSEYDDPRKRREIRSQYRNLIDATQSKDYRIPLSNS